MYVCMVVCMYVCIAKHKIVSPFVKNILSVSHPFEWVGCSLVMVKDTKTRETRVLYDAISALANVKPPTLLEHEKVSRYDLHHIYI